MSNDKLREALRLVNAYPGIRKHIGTEIHDKVLEALAIEPQPAPLSTEQVSRSQQPCEHQIWIGCIPCQADRLNALLGAAPPAVPSAALWVLQWRAKEHVLESAKGWSYVHTSATSPAAICLAFESRADAEKAANDRNANQNNAEYRVVGVGCGPGTADEIMHFEQHEAEIRNAARLEEAEWWEGARQRSDMLIAMRGRIAALKAASGKEKP